jgi:hypothetical protein
VELGFNLLKFAHFVDKMKLAGFESGKSTRKKGGI